MYRIKNEKNTIHFHSNNAYSLWCTFKILCPSVTKEDTKKFLKTGTLKKGCFTIYKE